MVRLRVLIVFGAAAAAALCQLRPAAEAESGRRAAADRFALATTGPDAGNGADFWLRQARTAISALAVADGGNPDRDPAGMRARLRRTIRLRREPRSLWRPLARHPDRFAREVALDMLDRPAGEASAILCGAGSYLGCWE